MVPSLTMQEQEWLRAQHPKLFYFPGYGRIVGDFEFKASYNNVAVKDSYQVRIELNETSFFMPIPKVYVMDNRIERASKILKREMIDMHVFSDGSLCLIRPDKIQDYYPMNQVSLQSFIYHLTAYFYWQSFLETYGKEPWKGEAHDFPYKI